MLSLESGNEVQEKTWIVFCQHIQSWWTFNYQPLSGTSWAGLQEKGKWQCGVWAGLRRSSAWKDVDWLQHTALSRPGFLSCHRTESLFAWHPSFRPLSVTFCSFPSLPLAVSVLSILQPPHSSSVCFQTLIPLSLPHHCGSSSPALSPQLGPHQLLPNPVMWWGPAYASAKINYLSGLLILLHLFPSFVSGLIPQVPEQCLCPFLADHLSK